MRLDHTVRVNTAILLLIVSASISNIRYVTFAAKFSPSRIGKDGITLYEKKFTEIKKDLPAHGTIGYITDKKYRFLRYDRDAAGYYYMTQYILSPVLVDYYGKGYPFVLGNFRNIPAGLKNASDAGLVLEKDYGNGLMLFKRKAE